AFDIRASEGLDLLGDPAQVAVEVFKAPRHEFVVEVSERGRGFAPPPGNFAEGPLKPFDPVFDLTGVVAVAICNVYRGIRARDLLYAAREILEPKPYPGKIVGARGGLRLRLQSVLRGGDVAPFVRRRSGPAGRCTGGLVGFVNSFDAPRQAKSHARTCFPGGVAESPDRPSRNRSTLMTACDRARSIVHAPTFCRLR